MTNHRIKNLFFGILTLLGTFCVIYLAGEAVIYALYKKEMAIFPRYVTARKYNDYIIRGNIPNAEYWHKSADGKWKFKINNQGFRSDADFDYPKPEKTLRVLVLGDSFTAGYEVSQEETYAEVLGRALQRRGIQAQVLNAGVSGFSTAEELVFLEQEGLRYRPDVVVLGFYANDLSDNIRTGLFKLEKNELVVQRKEYATAAGARDLLNSFFVYRWLSENSYLHNYLNAAATVWVKRWIEQDREREMEKLQTSSDSSEKYQEALACRLVERVHRVAAQNKARFILLEIPKWSAGDISSSWPKETCSPESVSDFYVEGLSLLQKNAPGETWYRPNGHHHWTPISHEVIGEYLASLIAGHPEIRGAFLVQKSRK